MNSLYQQNYVQYDIKSKFDKIHNMPDYVERRKIIELKMNNGINNLEKENENLQYEKNRLHTIKMREIITKDNIDEIFTYNIKDEEGKLIKFEDVINNQYYPLIKYLIRNGYIDETYFDYLTYFYENNLTRTDKIFLRSITDQIAKDFNYKLNDISKIINRLKVSDFAQEEVLNFDLLSYLLSNQHEYLRPLLNQVKSHQRFDFVWAYVVQATDANKFVEILNQEWKDLWVFLLSNKDITEEQKKRYMISTLYSSCVNEINHMNIEDCITSYISNKLDFLDIDEPDIPVIIEKLIGVNVFFKYIDYEKSNIELFNEVYKNNLYDLNFDMIQLILKNIYNITPNNDFKRKNYTLISSRPEESLKQYVDKNINYYIKLVLDNKIDRIIDSEESVLFILNNTNVDNNLKISYIRSLGTVIYDISMVNEKESLWEELLKNRTIKYSVHNVITYYFMYDRTVDTVLVDFLNDNSDTIIFDPDEIEKDFQEYNINEFYSDVIKTMELTNNKYDMILNGYQHRIEEFVFANISNDKLKILIQLGIIGMTKENIKFIRSNYLSLSIFFIRSNIKQYINCLDDEILEEDEILELLNQECISDELKVLLIKNYPNNISIMNDNYSQDVQLYIMANKFDNNDLVYIINNYTKGSLAIKEESRKLCIVNAEAIYNNKLKLPFELLCVIMVSTQVEDYYKKSILYYHLNLLSVESVKECLSCAKLTDFVTLFEGKRPKILDTDENKNILAYFKDKGWILRFDQDSREPQYYRVIGKRYIEKKNDGLDIQLL
jgi:hypothetical protein